MGSRRKGRELALQILYQIDMGGKSPREVLETFWSVEKVPDEVQAFATQLVWGVIRNLKEIDALLEKHSAHWKLTRMAVVDRNILRSAAYEIIYLADVPLSVTLNEAIEIAKRYGTADSSAFINGILDNLSKSR